MFIFRQKKTKIGIGRSSKESVIITGERVTFVREKPSHIQLPIVVLIIQQGNPHILRGKAIVCCRERAARYFGFRNDYAQEPFVAGEGRGIIIKLKSDYTILVADVGDGYGNGIRWFIFFGQRTASVFHEQGMFVVRIAGAIGSSEHRIGLRLNE